MASSSASSDEFPWQLGVFDAHCHPTDTMSAIAAIPHMKAAALTIMASRGEDQHLVEEVASKLGRKSQSHDVQDQKQDAAVAAAAARVVPCFGWHPWFAHQIYDDLSSPATTTNTPPSKIAHYRSVLTGSTADDDAFFLALPDPKPLSTLLAETRARLLAHPDALVGEIGLDKAFRLPNVWQPHELEARDPSITPGAREGRSLSVYRVAMSHQRALLKAQLQLAGELRRPVSIHSVQTHGAVFDLLQELWRGHEMPSRRERKRRRAEAARQAEEEEEKDEQKSKESSPLPFPPRICLHSYTGPLEPLKRWLHQTVPSDVYFSFSVVINFTSYHPFDKVAEVIRALPDDRILIESDFHCAGEQMDALLEEVARTVCKVRGWTLEQGVKQLAENWRRFVYG
ncbi:hypothetical protein VTN96DRAFT_7587 [Rasamsonia emersonii]